MKKKNRSKKSTYKQKCKDLQKQLNLTRKGYRELDLQHFELLVKYAKLQLHNEKLEDDRKALSHSLDYLVKQNEWLLKRKWWQKKKMPSTGK